MNVYIYIYTSSYIYICTYLYTNVHTKAKHSHHSYPHPRPAKRRIHNVAPELGRFTFAQLGPRDGDGVGTEVHHLTEWFIESLSIVYKYKYKSIYIYIDMCINICIYKYFFINQGLSRNIDQVMNINPSYPE